MVSRLHGEAKRMKEMSSEKWDREFPIEFSRLGRPICWEARQEWVTALYWKQISY